MLSFSVEQIAVDMSKPIDPKLWIDNQMTITYFQMMSTKMNSLRKVTITDAFIMCLMFVNAFKSFVLIFINADFETSILLADITVFIGGVRGYSLMNIVLPNILGLLLHKHFYIDIRPKLMAWSEIFDVLRGNQKPQLIGFENNDSEEFNKFLKRSTIVLNLMNLAIVSLSQLIITVYYKIIDIIQLKLYRHLHNYHMHWSKH